MAFLDEIINSGGKEIGPASYAFLRSLTEAETEPRKETEKENTYIAPCIIMRKTLTQGLREGLEIHTVRTILTESLFLSSTGPSLLWTLKSIDLKVKKWCGLTV